jgi:hypothetical protein
MKSLGVTYTELRLMPIRYRNWFIERCIKLNEPAKTTRVGAIELDDDTPISSILGKMNK